MVEALGIYNKLNNLVSKMVCTSFHYNETKKQNGLSEYKTVTSLYPIEIPNTKSTISTIILSRVNLSSEFTGQGCLGGDNSQHLEVEIFPSGTRYTISKLGIYSSASDRLLNPEEMAEFEVRTNNFVAIAPKLLLKRS